ncbi:MAG TPA: amino acid ABC transporter permease [Gammaproteobacteria bacterium]|jgi:polar amino acid transport system permease protein|nr:amino acid ABC transporter permease [Acidiferrobacteraceae bacterium]MAW70142.1 amino acid ABC transporter permease [Acidiferrobacteraceae bacterium]HAA36104.1 amino acid ABC transporter permease [Gammaproteobacteria bacterium]HAF74360.1 amino acid ABC transporter permease [Gammaproteobacteria bacterium]
MAARKKTKSGVTRAVDTIVIASAIFLVAYIIYKVDTVMIYEWHWGFLWEYILRWDEEQQAYAPNLLLKGLATTFRLVIWSMLLASIIGIVMGIMRTSSRVFFRTVSRLYVEFIRNMPPVVFIFVFFFFLSSQFVPLLGIDELSVNASPETIALLEILLGPPELFANVISGILCLALFEGAYITEIIRAGIQSIDKGQTEAGQSIGLTRFQTLRWVIFPQAVQKVIPPLTGQFITLIKDSSIVSLISIQELTFLAQEVAYSTQYVFEIWLFVAGVYFCICYSLALLFAKLEKHSQRIYQG